MGHPGILTLRLAIPILKGGSLRCHSFSLEKDRRMGFIQVHTHTQPQLPIKFLTISKLFFHLKFFIEYNRHITLYKCKVYNVLT